MRKIWGAFNTPSLREVSRTAPYMHDGSLATLDEVIAFYNEGGGESGTAGLEPLNLSEEEIGQLVAFLESLSSEPIEVTCLNCLVIRWYPWVIMRWRRPPLLSRPKPQFLPKQRNLRILRLPTRKKLLPNVRAKLLKTPMSMPMPFGGRSRSRN